MANPLRIEVNAEEVAKEIGVALGGVKEELDISLADMMDIIFTKSQDYVPVLTGHLKRSGDNIKIKFGEYEIEYGAPYAVHVEYGTATMIALHGEHSVEHPVTMWPAKRRRGAADQQQMPFLRPAINEGKEKLPEIAKKRISKLKKR